MSIFLSNVDRDRLRRLAEIEPNDLDRLIEAFRSVGVQPTLADFIAQASLRAGDATSKVGWMVDTLNRLNRRRLLEGLDVDQFVQNLNLPFILGDKLDRAERLSQQLTSMLATGIGTITKALDLLAANPRTFRSSRTITDMRAIFKPETEQGVEGVVIVHTLQIRYIEADRETVFDVALDAGDLKALQKSITKALEKAKVLEDLAKSVSLPTFNLVPR